MSKTKILVVEDELITAKGIRSALKSLGYDVLDIVSSGEEAIQKASEIHPDLILMDIKLDGDMDGIEAARQIKDRFSIPVVYLTAHADDATLARAMITEPYGYILKPFEDRDLHIGIEIALYKHQMEEKLIQSEKLKSIGTITAGIAHEFNNILAIISGNVQLLEGSRKNDEELMDALRTIKRATNNGAEISRRMLKFTKTAKDMAGFVPIDINELIHQAIDFTMPRWKNMAQTKGINYHMDTEGMKRVPSILCNPTELREVFINIINNSLDAMPDEGRISFSTWSEEDTVFISISDTGEGMPEEVKKNIFDPFFTTKTAVGTGLGLSTAYGIIIGHGGKMEVESEVGSGSTFTLQFPAAAKADSPKESPEPKQEIKANSLRILVVDDEEEICDILGKFFSKKGHLVRTVDNGREAIILTKAADYDLVLSDMAMPEVYGYDVIKALNKLEKRPKIGIITGWGEKLKPMEDEDLKVDFIIKKPFDFSELERHINDVLNA
jgi:signal transduction histidine kinase